MHKARIYVKLLTDEDVNKMLETLLLIVSVLIIAIVLLQSNKASDAGQIITGGNETLFQNMKERGVELFISRLTFLLGLAFFTLCTFISFIK